MNIKKIAHLVFAVGFVATCILIFNSCKDKDPDPVAPQLDPPTIASINPLKGTTATTVTITGTNFSATTTGNAVKFNGKAATVNTATATQLVVAVPADAGTGKVSVATEGGSVEGPEFTYFSAPTIATIAPTSAKFNASVVISGTNFDPATVSVKINNKPVTVTASSPTQLTVTIPKAVGTGKVSVSTTGGDIDGPVLTYELTATVTTLAGDGSSGYADGTGASAKFNIPGGIAFDIQGNLYVCDRNNHRIRKITPSGVTTTFAGSGTPGVSDGNGTSAQFYSPIGITSDSNGDFFITDSGSGNIRKMTSTGTVTTIAGSGTPGIADGTGSAASFQLPTSIIVDKQGNLIVADFGASIIRKVTLAGVVTTIAGDGSLDFVPGNGTAAHIGGAWGIVQDSQSDFYFSSFDNGRILKMNTLGDVTSFAGDGTSAFADGPVQTAKFKAPYGIVIDKNGDFIISDGSNNRIRKISGGVVSTIAGDGTAGFVNGEGSVARFSLPYGLSINSTGEIFVCDRANHSIRKIVLE